MNGVINSSWLNLRGTPMTHLPNTNLYAFIEVRGARENNLKSVSVDIP